MQVCEALTAISEAVGPQFVMAELHKRAAANKNPKVGWVDSGSLCCSSTGSTAAGQMQLWVRKRPVSTTAAVVAHDYTGARHTSAASAQLSDCQSSPASTGPNSCSNVGIGRLAAWLPGCRC
jgi:hypothetical protein